MPTHSPVPSARTLLVATSAALLAVAAAAVPTQARGVPADPSHHAAVGAAVGAGKQPIRPGR